MLIGMDLRPNPSRLMVYISPIIAVFLTILAAMIMFKFLDVDPIQAIKTFFIEPISSLEGLAELCIKATPLILIGVGLSFGFQADIWNIGAEGQLTIGALAGGGLAIAFYNTESVLLLPAMLLAGILGGMAWGAIPAWLKSKFNTNEILSSLMMTYVGLLVLGYLIHGPWKDPEGQNFPESRLFHDAAVLPILLEETRLNIGSLIALLVVVAALVITTRHVIGFQIKVLGMAPLAANFAGYKEKKLIWLTFMLSGGCAGLAGIIEVSGAIGQIVPTISPGYGFTAIIVAFLGRLHPIGIVFAGLLMALTYLGGDSAQITMNLPNAVTGVFQGMLLFFLLASDVLIKYRIRFRGSKRVKEPIK